MSSGTSSGSSLGTRSPKSEDDLDLQAQMERRRKRRKESNRESARRSRLRKQQHLDDLTSQVYMRYLCCSISLFVVHDESIDPTILFYCRNYSFFIHVGLHSCAGEKAKQV